MNENKDEVNKEDKHGRKKTILITVSMGTKDEEILNWLIDFLGSSRSEAVRTAIRSFAGQMQSLERKPGRPKKGEEGGGF